MPKTPDHRRLPEEQCPQCGGPLTWKIVRDAFGAPSANGLCLPCCLVLRGREAPDITTGRKLAQTGKFDGLSSLDKRITSLPVDVQIGLLRELRHTAK